MTAWGRTGPGWLGHVAPGWLGWEGMVCGGKGGVYPYAYGANQGDKYSLPQSVASLAELVALLAPRTLPPPSPSQPAHVRLTLPLLLPTTTPQVVVIPIPNSKLGEEAVKAMLDRADAIAAELKAAGMQRSMAAQQHGMAWHGRTAAWHGMAWHGGAAARRQHSSMAWHGGAAARRQHSSMAWHGGAAARRQHSSMAWHGTLPRVLWVHHATIPCRHARDGRLASVCCRAYRLYASSQWADSISPLPCRRARDGGPARQLHPWLEVQLLGAAGARWACCHDMHIVLGLLPCPGPAPMCTAPTLACHAPTACSASHAYKACRCRCPGPTRHTALLV